MQRYINGLKKMLVIIYINVFFSQSMKNVLLYVTVYVCIWRLSQ